MKSNPSLKRNASGRPSVSVWRHARFSSTGLAPVSVASMQRSGIEGFVPAATETSMFDTGLGRVIKGAAGDLVRGTVSSAIGGQAGRSAGSMAGGVLGGLMQGSGRKDSIVEVVAKSAARSIGSSVGRQIVRGVLGGLMGGLFGKR